MRQGAPDEHSTFGIPRAGRTRTLVRAALLDPGAFPVWSPALRALEANGRGAVGRRYALTAGRGLTGHFWYAAIEPGRIVTRWEVSRFAELGTGVLAQQDSRSRVVHEFVHAGLLAAALAPAYSGAAKLRLVRLAKYLHTSTSLKKGTVT